MTLKWKVTLGVGAVVASGVGYFAAAHDCPGFELSRAQAETLLTASGHLQRERPALRVRNAFVDQGIKRGLWKRSHSERSCSYPQVVTQTIVLTDAGKKALEDGALNEKNAPFGQIEYICDAHLNRPTDYTYTAKANLGTVLPHVTGITELPLNEGMGVEFWCEYAIPSDLENFIDSKAEATPENTSLWQCRGHALVRLYDDGWRVTSVTINQSTWTNQTAYR